MKLQNLFSWKLNKRILPNYRMLNLPDECLSNSPKLTVTPMIFANHYIQIFSVHVANCSLESYYITTYQQLLEVKEYKVRSISTYQKSLKVKEHWVRSITIHQQSLIKKEYRVRSITTNQQSLDVTEYRLRSISTYQQSFELLGTKYYHISAVI